MWFFKVRPNLSAQFVEASSDEEAMEKLNPTEGEKVFGSFYHKEDALEALSSYIDSII